VRSLLLQASPPQVSPPTIYDFMCDIYELLICWAHTNCSHCKWPVENLINCS